MRVSVLIENTARVPDLIAEHGLSLYIETENLRLLFDTGATGAFADNAVQMGIDLFQVDALILSHGHYDHGGGFEAFLQCNLSAPVYLSAHAFEEHYNGAGKYIGLPRHLENHPRLIPVLDRLALAPGVLLDCCCAHRGVENILHWLAPDILIGGFHFKQLSPGDVRLEQAAQRLLASSCEYYTCHCTGQPQYAYLKERMGSKLHYLSTGDVVDI